MPAMLAFKIESWIWYGVVLFVAVSRLYVYLTPAISGFAKTNFFGNEVYPDVWRWARSTSSRQMST